MLTRLTLLACLGLSLLGGEQLKTRLRFLPTDSATTLLTIDDLTWSGGYQIASDGLSAGDYSGSVASYATVAVRYTNSVPASGSCKDTRRLLIPSFSNYSRTVTAISTGVGTQTITVSSAHNLTTGRVIYLASTDSTPSIDGAYAVTVTGASTFTVTTGITVTVAGVGAGDGVISNVTKAWVSPRTWGDLVEYCESAATTRYTGSAWSTSAPALLEVRRWVSDEWTSPMNGLGDVYAGNQLGGLWWDEAQQVLWVNIYGYYNTNNQPTYMAVALGNGAHASLSGYKAVGTRYGPWFYRSTVAGGGHVEWKAINHGFSPVPTEWQSDLGGRAMFAGGAVGSTGGSGHLGLGLRAMNLPSLGTTPLTVMSASDNGGLGLKIADYSAEFAIPYGLPYQAARRNGANYTRLPFTDHMDADTGLWASTGAGAYDGYWQMSLDQTNGFVAIQTATRRGVLSFGREVTGGVGYGYNPLSRTIRHITSISSLGNTVSVQVNNHKLLTGATVNVNCIQPAGYAGAFTITVTGTHTFTYTTVGTNLGTASYTSSGSTSTGLSCANPAAGGEMSVIAWDTRVQADAVDGRRDVPGDSNGYVGETFTGVLRVMDPTKIRLVGGSGFSPFSDYINWLPTVNVYTKWPNMAKYSTLDGSATTTGINQFSVNTNGMVWDSTANEIVWCIGNSAADAFAAANFRPTCQFFTVPH